MMSSRARHEGGQRGTVPELLDSSRSLALSSLTLPGLVERASCEGNTFNTQKNQAGLEPAPRMERPIQAPWQEIQPISVTGQFMNMITWP